MPRPREPSQPVESLWSQYPVADLNDELVKVSELFVVALRQILGHRPSDTASRRFRNADETEL